MHAHTHTHARVHVCSHTSDEGISMAVKNSLEIIIKQLKQGNYLANY